MARTNGNQVADVVEGRYQDLASWQRRVAFEIELGAVEFVSMLVADAPVSATNGDLGIPAAWLDRARAHEAINGPGSMLRLDHPFNIQMAIGRRTKAERDRVRAQWASKASPAKRARGDSGLDAIHNGLPGNPRVVDRVE